MTARTFYAIVLSLAFTAPLALTAGCGREVSHTETDKTSSDGPSVHKETTVTQNPDGTINKTQQTETHNP